ncbi:MAG TPA: hypothetical protein VN929_05750 [Burkholderiales bacterium]|nr:hypothetical protein [Burkholderiales bacterium]
MPGGEHDVLLSTAFRRVHQANSNFLHDLWGIARNVVARLALAFLQYFYASTYLDIESIRSLIVFVLVNGQLPPV